MRDSARRSRPSRSAAAPPTSKFGSLHHRVSHLPEGRAIETFYLFSMVRDFRSIPTKVRSGIAFPANPPPPIMGRSVKFRRTFTRHNRVQLNFIWIPIGFNSHTAYKPGSPAEHVRARARCSRSCKRKIGTPIGPSKSSVISQSHSRQKYIPLRLNFFPFQPRPLPLFAMYPLTTMATERQIQANRANAAKSTGPITPEGKRASSQNAVRHNLVSTTVVLKGESKRRFNDLAAALTLQFQPRNSAETFLVQTMTVARWRLLRMWGIQTAGFELEMARAQNSDPSAGSGGRPCRRHLFAIWLTAPGPRPQPGLETAYDRQYNRALALLRRCGSWT